MGSFSVVALLVMAGIRHQIDNRVPVRLPIRHADPWMVKAMLEGSSPNAPELSTIWGVTGGSQRGGGQQNNQSTLLTDGYLVVNPTDNSLWWYPKRTSK